MKLTKTSGVIESLMMSCFLILPMIVFMKPSYVITFYVFGCFFLLFGLMSNLFMSEPVYTSFIMNTVKTKIEGENDKGKNNKCNYK